MSSNTDDRLSRDKERFKEHIATLIQYGDSVKEITFMKKDTCWDGIRFMLTRNYIFVYGDLGEAVYELSEKADIRKIAEGYDLYYLTSKLRTVAGGKYIFDSDRAVEEIESEMNELNENELKEKKSAYQTFIELAKECGSSEEWNVMIARNESEADELGEWYEWLPSAGRTLNGIVALYWVALKMALKQLGYDVQRI